MWPRIRKKSTDPFQPFPLKDLIRRAEIEDGARKLAANQLPGAGETELSYCERRAIDLVETRVAERREDLEQEAAALQQWLAELPTLATDRNRKFLPHHVTNSLMKIFQELAPEIRTTTAQYKELEAEHRAFRSQHGLEERAAHYPRSRLAGVATIVLVASLEACLNTALFKEATSSGLLGGLVTALSVSAANIIAAVFTALAPMRYLRLPSLWQKFWAIPALIAAIHERIEAVREEEIVIVADRPDRCRADLSEIQDDYVALSQKTKTVQALDARDLDACKTAIARFRSLNLSIRTDGLTPQYFDSAPDLDHLGAGADQPSRRIAALVHSAEQDHADYFAAYNDLVAQMFERIETAKDNTAQICQAIERSYLDDGALPDLATLRNLILEAKRLAPLSPATAATVH